MLCLDSQGVVACLRCSRAKGGLEELDMGLLVVHDLLEASPDPRGKAGVGECFGIVLVQSSGIEGVLEVLQRQRVLKDLCVYVRM